MLNKYSDPQYFNVPKAERLIKYLKCAELFDEINYSKSKLYENIADCYYGLEKHKDAIRYIEEAIAMEEKTLFASGETIE